MKIKEIYRLVKAKLRDRKGKRYNITYPGFSEENELAIQSMNRALNEGDRVGYEEAFNRIYLNIITDRTLNQRRYQSLVSLMESYKERKKDTNGIDQDMVVVFNDTKIIHTLNDLLDSFKERIVIDKMGLESFEAELSPRIVFGGAKR